MLARKFILSFPIRFLMLNGFLMASVVLIGFSYDAGIEEEVGEEVETLVEFEFLTLDSVQLPKVNPRLNRINVNFDLRNEHCPYSGTVFLPLDKLFILYCSLMIERG